MALIGPVNVSDEQVVYTTSDVRMRIGKQEVGSGILFITEQAFIWKPNNKNEGIHIPWPKIILHAISGEPERNIYLQLSFALEWAGVYDPNLQIAQNGNGGGDQQLEDDEIDEGNVSDNSESEQVTDIYIMPQDSNTINQIYYAMNHCQSVNPDPNDSISEEDEDFMEAEGNESDENAPEIRNLNIDDDDEQFADAE